MPRSYADAAGSSRTLRWRKTDSNSRSLREGTGYGEPLQGSIAVSNLNLKVALPFVPPPPIGNAQKSLSQERDRSSARLQTHLRELRSPNREIAKMKPPTLGSFLTLCWREQDSNHRFRGRRPASS